MRNTSPFLGAGLLLAGAAYFLSTRKKSSPKRKGFPRGDADKRFTEHFDPDAGQPISVPEAAKLAKKYKKKYKDNTSSNYCNIEAVDAIRDATDCYGIRIYRTLDDSNTHGIVIVGVDREGRDILGAKDGLPYATIAVESYEKCPYNCDGSTLTK